MVRELRLQVRFSSDYHMLLILAIVLQWKKWQWEKGKWSERWTISAFVAGYFCASRISAKQSSWACVCRIWTSIQGSFGWTPSSTWTASASFWRNFWATEALPSFDASALAPLVFELRLEVCPETFSSSSKITDEAFFDALIRFYID